VVTAKEIAEAARISRSTVQRALSGSPSVSRETRKRILEIAHSAGYRPNRHARALVMRRQKVGYAAILTVPENSFMQEVLKGISRAREELKDSGGRLSIRFMETIDGVEQARLIDTLVRESVKGIVMIPVDCPEVREAVARGVRSGTAFVTLATDLTKSRRLCFVGQDNVASGRVAGELMSFLLKRGEKVACFAGSLQFLGHAQRLEGFRRRYLESHAADDIVAVIETFDSSRLSEKLTRRLLEETPDLAGIFVAGGGMEGICRAVRTMGRAGAVRMVGYDLAQSARFCRDGVIDFVIDQDPVQQGYRALSVLNSFVLYGETPEERQLMRIDIRTKETVGTVREGVPM
jgi:LacI family transcriptional regulator